MSQAFAGLIKSLAEHIGAASDGKWESPIELLVDDVEIGRPPLGYVGPKGLF